MASVRRRGLFFFDPHVRATGRPPSARLRSTKAFFERSGYRATVQTGYHCEECEEAIFPVTTRSELQWLKNRRHVVQEVAKHVSGGLDSWMVEGLAFLDKHEGHSVVVTQRR